MAYTPRPAVKPRDPAKERQAFEAARSVNPYDQVIKDISGIARSVWDAFRRKPRKPAVK